MWIAAAAALVTFNIRSQPLNSALGEWVAQVGQQDANSSADLRLEYQSDSHHANDAARARTRPLRGSFTPREAACRLFRSTELNEATLRGLNSLRVVAVGERAVLGDRAVWRYRDFGCKPFSRHEYRIPKESLFNAIEDVLDADRSRVRLLGSPFPVVASVSLNGSYTVLEAFCRILHDASGLSPSVRIMFALEIKGFPEPDDYSTLRCDKLVKSRPALVATARPKPVALASLQTPPSPARETKLLHPVEACIFACDRCWSTLYAAQLARRECPSVPRPYY
jgi:hypothetical protein